MNDEGFREIQLNGKQLVFLFMAATVVSVVIFLCGVLVGRGVRGGAVAEIVGAGPEIAADASAAPAPAPSAPVSAGSPPAPTESPAPPPAEELSYADRLLRETPPEENLKPAPAKPVEQAAAPIVREPITKEPAAAARPPAQPLPAPSAPAPARTPAPTQAPPARGGSSQVASTVPASDPSGPGFAVQVAIYKNRPEADTLAKELVAKGYPAFVMDPAKGAPAGIYRVRIGKYKNRKDAEDIAARLKTAEQFDPWIAR